MNPLLLRRLVVFLVVILLVFAGWFLYRSFFSKSPLSSGEWSLQPVTSDATGVAVTSDFVLRSGSDVAASQVKAMLSVKPMTEFVSTQRSSREVLIHFAKPLQENTVYAFYLTDVSGAGVAQAAETVLDPKQKKSWAFQTQNPFRVTETLPNDKTSGVPTDTGIEMTFSVSGVTLQTMERFFEISPQVDGRFETHDKTVVFVPEKLQPGTIYTVTVRKGITFNGGTETLKEDTVFRFETKPEEDTQGGGWSGFVRSSYESSTRIKPAVDIYVSDFDAKSDTAQVRVLAAPDEASFLAEWKRYRSMPSWASYGRDAFRFHTDGWAEAARFTTPFHTFTQSASAYVEFPETMPTGKYVLEVMIGSGARSKTLQTVFQVSDVSAFVSTSEEKSVIWTNDVTSKRPIRNAEVVWLENDTVLGRTNDQGLLSVDTPNDLRVSADASSYSFLRVRQSDQQSLIVPVENNVDSSYGWWSDSLDRDNYWSYLSTDRKLYQPTDTVGFWGVVRDRKQLDRAIPLTLVVSSGENEVWRQSLTTSKVGTFTGEIQLENWDTGSYQLEVWLGETFIMGKWVDVQTYSKPAYQLSLESDKKAIFAGETLTVNGRASFFEGTSVPQAGIVVSADDFSRLSAPNESDKQGKFTIQYTPKEPKKESGRYGDGYGSQRSIDVAAAGPEEGDISTSVFVRVFGSRSGFDLEKTTIHDGQAVFSGTVRRVLLDRLNNGTARDDADFWGDSLANQKIRVKAARTVWDKVETGENYDFIEKRIVKQYEWKTREEKLDDTEITTDSEGKFFYRPNIDARSMFRVTFEVSDDQGNVSSISDYAYGDESSTSEDAYTLSDRLDSSKNKAKTYHVGDAIQLVLAKGGKAVESAEGRKFLYMREQNGIREVTISDRSEYTTSFSEADIPNMVISGVYFTGETYVPVPEFFATFERDDRKLTIQVVPDKSMYQPQDEVRVRVRTTDPDGKPKPAEVNLGVVDEALFALSEQSVNPLMSLYMNVGDGVISTYASHQYPESTQLAERGGGGGGRSVFPDRVFFGSTMTNADGQGEFVFKVPDNLTSWRLTAQGVSADLFAGDAKGTIAVKQQFFVDVVVAKDYLESDRPVVNVRAYGEGLQSGQAVQYTVTGDEASGLTEQILNGTAFESMDIVLPKLVEGKHTLTIAGVSGDLKDTLTRSFSVVKTRLDKQQTQFIDVQSNSTIEGSDTGRTRIVLSDAGRGQWYSNLIGQALSVSDRIDRRLAREQAKKLLQMYFNEDAGAEPIDWRAYQDAEDGGVKLLSYGQSNFSLSLRIAFAQPEGIDVSALALYFEELLTEEKGVMVTTDVRAQALAGLLALRQPVLFDVQKLAEDASLLVDTRLAIGLGLVIAGDEETARKVYSSLQGGIQAGNGERWLASDTPNETLAITASLAELSGLLGESATPEYIRYLDQHPSKEIVVDLERTVALAPTLAQVKQSVVAFDYTLNGQVTHATLEKNETLSLSLSPEDRKSLRIQNIQGLLGATVSYAVPWQSVDTTQNGVSLEREFVVDGKVTTELRLGDRVWVTLRPSFRGSVPDGCYRVTDALPSGLKVTTVTPLDFNWNWDDDEGDSLWYPYAITGQKVSFCTTKKQKPIVYIARVIGKGMFTAEGAVIQSENDPMVVAASMPQIVTISE
ncbi:MAG: Ig-like domain-containing protein [Candidatus Moraniibacteriota bacterium]